MKNNWKKFMLESNRIEGEDRVNPGDENALTYACAGISSLDDILKIHQLLGKYLKKSWVGKFRDCRVMVGGNECPQPASVPYLMEDYIKNFDTMDSYEAHNRFEKIHSFQDLNGRTGRLIWLSKVIYEGYNFEIPFLQMYYYQTLDRIKI